MLEIVGFCTVLFLVYHYLKTQFPGDQDGDD
jgi:hypothetical protein